MFQGQVIPNDLNNPKNIWRINKFCENRQQHFEYHRNVAAAFKQDCDRLLLAFEGRKDLTFKAFADVWQQLSFSLVFVGQEFVEELSMFAESCYFEIKKYLMFSTSVYTKVGAFYLLYGIFAKQPSKDVVKIRLTKDECLVLLKLVEEMRMQNVLDVVYIFNQLKFNDAFEFVAMPRCFGLEGKFTWHDKKMKNDIFQKKVEHNPMSKLKQILFSEDDYSLSSLEKISQEYDKALKEFSDSTATSSFAIRPESHLLENVKELYEQLNKDLQDENTTKEKESENISVRRKKIKEKSYRNK